MSAGAIVLAGGGTGGHVFPLVAVASALRELEPGLESVFVGTERGISPTDPDLAFPWPLPSAELRLSAKDLTAPGLLATLAAAGFDPARPAVATLLGVTVYLPPDDVQRLYGTLAALAPGSELVTTFSQLPAFGRQDALAQAAAAAGEPWLTRTTPDQLLRDLATAGFARAEILAPDEAWRRYFGDRSDGLRPSPRANLVRALTGP